VGSPAHRATAVAAMPASKPAGSLAAGARGWSTGPGMKGEAMVGAFLRRGQGEAGEVVGGEGHHATA
jgi:hypothetical protein